MFIQELAPYFLPPVHSYRETCSYAVLTFLFLFLFLSYKRMLRLPPSSLPSFLRGFFFRGAFFLFLFFFFFFWKKALSVMESNLRCRDRWVEYLFIGRKEGRKERREGGVYVGLF